MEFKPSELPKGSIIAWGGVWYVKYEEDLFMMLDPFMMQKPFIVADNPHNTPRQKYNMSVLPSDNFFRSKEASDRPNLISLGMEVVEHIAEELTEEFNRQWWTDDTAESTIEQAITGLKERRLNAQINKERTRSASTSSDEGQSGEAEKASRGEGFAPDYGRDKSS